MHMATVALTELPALVEEVLARLPRAPQGATILALQGNLGAGKTTFVQALGKKLGVQDTMQSPTYVLMKSYTTTHPQFKTLIHIDAYRLEQPEEFAALKPETFLHDPSTLVCIEWPEKAGALLPTPHLAIRFSSEGAGEHERQVDIL
jgi:tRNA threonylcarbamoyladenosine biosynthesis protein TsaE